jgi:hypothetical protein
VKGVTIAVITEPKRDMAFTVPVVSPNP